MHALCERTFRNNYVSAGQLWPLRGLIFDSNKKKEFSFIHTHTRIHTYIHTHKPWEELRLLPVMTDVEFDLFLYDSSHQVMFVLYSLPSKQIEFICDLLGRIPCLSQCIMIITCVSINQYNVEIYVSRSHFRRYSCVVALSHSGFFFLLFFCLDLITSNLPHVHTHTL